MGLEDDRQAWAAVARCLAPAYAGVSARILEGASGDPFDDMRWALNDSGLTAYIDWRSDPDDVRRDLKTMRKFPHKFRWGWYREFVGGGREWDPGEDTPSLLEEIGERCLDLGHALLSLELDADGYSLTAIDVKRLDILLDLTAAAGRRFRVIRKGCWTAPTPTPPAVSAPVVPTAADIEDMKHTVRLIDVVTERLTVAMSGIGFERCAPLDDGPAEHFRDGAVATRDLWFAAESSRFPATITAVSASLVREPGRIAVRGRAWLESPAVAEFLRIGSPNAHGAGLIESVPFGFFDDPRAMNRALHGESEAALGDLITRFMAYVHGPAIQWFADRDSLDKLFALARTGNPRSYHEPDSPDPVRLRATAILGVTNEHPGRTAELMHWYLHDHKRSARSVSSWDAPAFDDALAQRHNDYVGARRSIRSGPVADQALLDAQDAQRQGAEMGEVGGVERTGRGSGVAGGEGR